MHMRGIVDRRHFQRRGAFQPPRTARTEGHQQPRTARMKRFQNLLLLVAVALLIALPLWQVQKAARGSTPC